MRKLLSYLTSESGVIHTLPLLVIVAAVGLISYLLISSTAPFKGGLFGILNPRPPSNAQMMMTDQCFFLNSNGTQNMSATPAFCDTFDNIVGGGRAGDLDPKKWTGDRVSNQVNISQGLFDTIFPTDVQFCTQIVKGVVPNKDSFICGEQFGEPNHWMTAVNDGELGGSYQWIDARILQPFDFTNRTGTVVFDVDAKTAGSHTWWPEVWIADTPFAAVHHVQDNPTGKAVNPKNGIGFHFGNTACLPGFNPQAGAGVTLTDTKVSAGGLEDIYIDRNFAEQLISTGANCYVVQADHANHFEIRLSTTRVEVWASDKTDAHGTVGPNFKMVYSQTINPPLPFSRGYVTMSHSQYNAGKEGVTSQQTYHWHGIGFDGPAISPQRAYEVPNNTDRRSDGSINIGYDLDDVGLSFTMKNVDLTNFKAAWLAFNYRSDSNDPPYSFQYNLNGKGWRTFTDTHPNTANNSFGSILAPIALTDLIPGNNTLQMKQTNTEFAVANIDLLVDPVDNAPIPTPGPSMPATPTPIPTLTPAPVPTPVPGLISFIQVNAATPQSPQSNVTANYSQPQIAGDTNIVAIGWNDTTSNISSVTDSAGNLYQVAAPMSRGSGLSQAIYYAKNIKTSTSNTVTVNFNQAAAVVDLRVLEYRGLDLVNPFDRSSSSTGAAGGTASSGNATTTSANELIFGAGMTLGQYTGGGSGFTSRIITNPDADIAEDRVVGAIGSYNATAPVDNSWVMQLATFRAATGIVNPTPTPVPTPTKAPTPVPTPTPNQSSQITITAAGQAGVFNNQTIRPTMVLQINGVNKQTWNNVGGNGPKSQFLTFTYSSPTKVTHDQVRVRFTNDQFNGSTGQDINLWVKQITIDGVNFPSNAPSVFSNGVWTPSTGCSGGNKQLIELSCNGFFQY